MTGGMVTGGWEYVWAAYGVTVVVLGGYAASVVTRLCSERKREAERAKEQGGTR